MTAPEKRDKLYLGRRKGIDGSTLLVWEERGPRKRAKMNQQTDNCIRFEEKKRLIIKTQEKGREPGQDNDSNRAYLNRR